MHQRHPIRIDKSRTLPAGNDRYVTGSTPLSFHKIYRQKRCYSSLDRGKEGYSNNQTKYDCGFDSRDSSSCFETKCSTEPSGFWTNRRNNLKESIRSGSPSSPCLSTGNGKSERDVPRRPFDRFSCSFSPEPEFEAPVMKKQKFEFSKCSASQQYISPDLDAKAKLRLDETKWMYKNHHAKMSGPYGAKQLIEGLQSQFLQEDLPIYQLYEGKLCKPITLKQLMVDFKQSRCEPDWKSVNQSIPGQYFSQTNPEDTVHMEDEFPPNQMLDSERRQSPLCMPSECFTQVYAEERYSNEDDLPPGFGGRSSQFSQNSSTAYLPNIPTSLPDPRCSARSFCSFESEFGDTDIPLPPGFEGGPPMEQHSSGREFAVENCGASRNVSSCSAGPIRREEGCFNHSANDQPEHVLQDRVYSSWHSNSTQSRLGYSNPVSKLGSELPSNGHTSRMYPSTAAGFEPQVFSQTTVCIGRPVSQTKSQCWPSASHTGMPPAEISNRCHESVLARDTVSAKEPIGLNARDNQDPLSLILSELLAAVKRTYVSSVLSAQIGEQLDDWFDANKPWLVRSSSSGRDSPSSGSWQVSSRIGVGMYIREGSTSHAEASASAERCMLQGKASSATAMHPELLSETKDGWGSEVGCVVGQAASLGDSQQLSSVIQRNDMCPAIPANSRENSLSSTVHQSGVGDDKTPLCIENAENPFQGSDNKMDSCMPISHGRTRFPKCSSTPGMEPGPSFVGSKGKIQGKSVEGACDNDIIIQRPQSSGHLFDNDLPKVKQPGIATRSKKENMKSLKQIMLITSKIRSARLKTRLPKINESKQSCSKSSEVLGGIQRNEISICKSYNGCARTSSSMLSWKHQSHDEGQRVECDRLEDQNAVGRESDDLAGLQTLGLPAQAMISIGNSTAYIEDFDLVKMALSKVSKKRVKVARSKIHRWGLFSGEMFETGEFVIEYLGEVLRSRIANFREELYKKSGVGSDYLFRIDHESTVDATKRGGLARFINHSCDPNCHIKIIVAQGLKRVLVFAKRRICTDEEVTYDYELSRGVLNFRCSCGSSNCRGSAA